MKTDPTGEIKKNGSERPEKQDPDTTINKKQDPDPTINIKTGSGSYLLDLDLELLNFQPLL